VVCTGRPPQLAFDKQAAGSRVGRGGGEIAGRLDTDALVTLAEGWSLVGPLIEYTSPSNDNVMPFSSSGGGESTITITEADGITSLEHVRNGIC
jgi:hypothetical protein